MRLLPIGIGPGCPALDPPPLRSPSCQPSITPSFPAASTARGDQPPWGGHIVTILFWNILEY